MRSSLCARRVIGPHGLGLPLDLTGATSHCRSTLRARAGPAAAGWKIEARARRAGPGRDRSRARGPRAGQASGRHPSRSALRAHAHCPRAGPQPLCLRTGLGHGQTQHQPLRQGCQPARHRQPGGSAPSTLGAKRCAWDASSRRRAATADAFAAAARTDLVDLDLASEGLRLAGSGEDDLAQLAIEQDRAVAGDADQHSRDPSRSARDDVVDRPVYGWPDQPQAITR
jgi:hypothetical protein